MSVEAPLQFDMFSGKLVDNRTSTQKRIDHERDVPKQQDMFSIRETVQIGVNVRPWLGDMPQPTLELIREDPRTQEEIERDLMREAEALTDTLFADIPPQSSEDEPEREGVENENDQEQPQTPIAREESAKLASYRALVTLVREQAVTLWVDETYRQRFYSQLPQTILSAQGAGLTASEISAAMQIGEFLGNRERQAAGQRSGVIFDAGDIDGSPLGDAGTSEPAHPLPPASPQTTPSSMSAPEGLRARLRGERISVRTRETQSKPPEVVPSRWMEREHIQNRLPYLAGWISRLKDEEIASLAESISEALQHTYWTILEIALAHYVEHEQAEREEGATVGQLEPQTALG
jgi:hypothetical protein